MLELMAALFRPVAPDARRHYYAIDFARGLAALAVLAWHYQHFFVSTAGSDGLLVAKEAQPLYPFLKLFYLRGYNAVEFFWLISGFVFCAVYGGRRTTTRDFVVNRFARLYPLHLVTLLVVASLQVLSQNVVGHEQIYGNNDLRHFLLNLAFASQWGLEAGYSFNGPVWSISIEIVVYMTFWISLPFLYRSGVAGPAIASLGCLALKFHGPVPDSEHLFTCGFFFYAGAATYLYFAALQRRPGLLATTAVVLVLAGSLFIVLRPSSSESALPALLIGVLLLFCAIEASESRHLFRPLQWIGDNTYGTYLWHIPIQIVALIVLDRFVGSRDLALQPWFLVGFLLVTVAVARASFLWIEAPARDRLRRLGREGFPAKVRANATVVSGFAAGPDVRTSE